MVSEKNIYMRPKFTTLDVYFTSFLIKKELNFTANISADGKVSFTFDKAEAYSYWDEWHASPECAFSRDVKYTRSIIATKREEKRNADNHS